MGTYSLSLASPQLAELKTVMGKYDVSVIVPCCPNSSRFFAQSSKGKEERECCCVGRNCDDAEDGSLAEISFEVNEIRGARRQGTS